TPRSASIPLRLPARAFSQLTLLARPPLHAVLNSSVPILLITSGFADSRFRCLVERFIRLPVSSIRSRRLLETSHTRSFRLLLADSFRSSRFRYPTMLGTEASA